MRSESVDEGTVFLAAIPAAALLVTLVWVGLHANRVEAKAGRATRGVHLTAWAVVAVAALVYWLRDATPFMAAFSSVLVGGWLGGSLTYWGLRWLARLNAARSGDPRSY